MRVEMLTHWRMPTQRRLMGIWLVSSALITGAVQAQEYIDPASLAPMPTAAAVTDGRIPVEAAGPKRVAGVVTGSLEEAAALLKDGQLDAAVALYRKLVNTANEGQRAQARYGLAYALDQEGQDRAALEILSGTPADSSPVGQALANLRGEILLQLADAAWWGTDVNAGNGTTGVSNWLTQYDRLTAQPNPQRAQRLRNYLFQPNGLADAAGNAPLTVAVMVPLSGPLAPVGNALLQGLELGIQARAKQGGNQVVLKPLDTAGDGGAIGAARTALDQSASIVVGPLRAAEVAAAAGVLRPAGVPMISFSSDARVSAPGVWSAAFTPTGQAEKVVEALFSSVNGRHRAVGLVPDTAYGHDAWNAFAKAVQARGGTISGVSFFNPDQPDLAGNLKKLIGNWQAPKGRPGAGVTDTPPFDALFMPVPAGSLPLITAQLTVAGLSRTDVKLLGTALWQDPVILTPQGVGDLQEGWFAAPGQTPEFNTLYRGTYAATLVSGTADPSATSLPASTSDGVTPAAVLIASQGADVGRLLADVALMKPRLGLENGGLPGETHRTVDLTPLLTRPAGFPGQAGYLQLMPNGQSLRGQAVVVVGRQVTDPTTKALTFRVIAPALPLAPLPLPDNLLPPAGDRGKFW